MRRPSIHLPQQKADRFGFSSSIPSGRRRDPRRSPFVPAAMGFGGSSLSHCAAPFPAPFPPAAAASSSSSSSTLSPLAPPFTVDRAAPRPALPYDPYPSPWPPRTNPSDDYLHRRPPSPSPPPPGSPPRSAHGATAAALPYHGHGGSSGEAASRRNPNLARVDPYYPRFSSGAGTAVGDERGFYGGRQEGSVFGVGAPAEAVGGSSSWMERENAAVAPGYGVGFQQDASIAPGFVAYEDLQGDWHGKLTEPPSGKDHFKYEHLDWLDVGNNTGVTSDLSGTSALVPCTSVGVCYPHSSDMHTFVEGSKSSDFNSPYDRYICQANTERTDPRVFYPGATYFPAKVCATGSSASTSVDKCRLKNVNHVQHVNAYKNDMLHGGHLSIRPKEPSINLNFEHKEDSAGMNRGEDTIKNDDAKVNSSVMKITLPPSIESAKQISQNYSLRKTSDLRIANLNAPGPVESDREQNSFERLDENPSEDSPCWKGAPSSRRSVSNAFNTLVVSYAIGDQKFGGPHRRASDHPKVENEVVALHSSGLRKDRNIVMPSEDRRDGFESKNVNEVLAVNEIKNRTSAKNKLITGIANHCIDPTQGDSSSFYSLANDQLSFASKAVTDCSSRRRTPVISDPSSSALGIDAQVLLKTIHNLSELLLSSCLFDANLLKEHDKELVASAVNNLDMCLSRKPEFGITRSELFCHSDGYLHSRLPDLSDDVPKGGCQATGPEFIDRGVEQSNNKSISSEQGKMHSVSPNVSSHKFGNFLSTCDGGNLKKLSEKAMHEKIYVQGENPQSAPFESLWFGVEDAVCLLKYKLQLLRSNIVTDNSNRQLIEDVEWDASNVLKLPSQKYKNSVTVESMPPWKSTDSLLKNPSPEGKHENLDNFEKLQLTIPSGSGSKVDDMDASVMARFKVLKCRIDNLDAVDVEEQHGQLNPLKAVNNSEIHENICGPCPSDVKRNSAMEFQPVNDPAGWGYQLPFHSSVTEGEVSGRSSVQHHLTDYIGELSLSAHFSDHRVSERFCDQDVCGVANQSYGPDRRSGKHFITGVPDGSSDWEHVTEEEVTW